MEITHVSELANTLHRSNSRLNSPGGIGASGQVDVAGISTSEGGNSFGIRTPVITNHIPYASDIIYPEEDAADDLFDSQHPMVRQPVAILPNPTSNNLPGFKETANYNIRTPVVDVNSGASSQAARETQH